MGEYLKGSLIPALALATGIALSRMTGMVWWFGMIPLLSGIIIYIFLLNVSTDPVRAYRTGKWHAAWIVLIFTGTGIIDEALSRPYSLEEAYQAGIPDTVTCEITGILSKTYGDRIDVEIHGTNGAKARLSTRPSDLAAGDIIMVPAKIFKDISCDTTEIGRKIAPMLKASGILYTGKIYSNSIKKIGKRESPKYLFLRLRERIETMIERSHLNKETSSFLNAILMGDKTGLDEKTRLTFAQGGTAHMLALSGLHLGILAGLLMLILSPIRFIGKYKWAYAAAIVILWIYVFITGMSHSSVRACIMTTIAFIAIIFERKNFAGNTLCSACLLILVFDPGALFDAGFQLSVVCVGALIAFSAPLNPIGHRQHPALYYICGSLIATMVATAASLPLTSYYFSQIPLMFLPANVIILPLLPFYLAIAVCYVIMLCLGLELSWMGHFLDRGYDFMLWLMREISCGTEFVIDYQLPLWGVAVWLSAIFLTGLQLNRSKIK